MISGRYLCEEYASDALAEYAVVPEDRTREVPNPAWLAARAKLRQAYADLDRLQAECGLGALTNLEHQRRSMRRFKTAHGKLRQKTWRAWQKVEAVEQTPRTDPSTSAG